MPNPEYFNHPPPHYYPEDDNYEEQEQWMDHHVSFAFFICFKILYLVEEKITCFVLHLDGIR